MPPPADAPETQDVPEAPPLKTYRVATTVTSGRFDVAQVRYVSAATYAVESDNELLFYDQNGHVTVRFNPLHWVSLEVDLTGAAVPSTPWAPL